MGEVKIEEAVQKIKQNKYKSALRRKKFINSIKVGIIFAISMIILRIVTLWIIGAESNLSFKEVLMNRYYYSSGNIGLFGYLNLLFGKQVESIPMVVNVILLPIWFAVLALMIILWIIFPFNMRMICVIDNIIPNTGNVLMWWFIYMGIIGVIGALIANKNVTKGSISSKEGLENRIDIIKKVRPVLWVFFIISIVSSTLIWTKYIGNEPKEGIQNHYNIKELVDD